MKTVSGISLDDVLDRSHVVALPMRVKFRGVTTREALLIDGPRGWGEFSPFLEYKPPEAAHWLAAGLEAAYQGLPTPAHEFVEVNATIPAVPAEHVEEVLARYPGCTTVKVKVAEKGQTLADDVARVEAVRALRPQATIRVDANRGWTVSQALEAAAQLGELEYMEQPCYSVEELKELRTALRLRGITAKVAADESIRKASDPLRVARMGAADVAVVKVAPLGGVRNVLTLADTLSHYGMSITIASALDTAVGVSGGLAAVDKQNAAGLATSSLFVEDIADRELIDGTLPTRAVSPDPARLEELAAPADRRDWWFERVRAAWLELRV